MHSSALPPSLYILKDLESLHDFTFLASAWVDIKPNKEPWIFSLTTKLRSYEKINHFKGISFEFYIVWNLKMILLFIESYLVDIRLKIILFFALCSADRWAEDVYIISRLVSWRLSWGQRTNSSIFQGRKTSGCLYYKSKRVESGNFRFSKERQDVTSPMRSLSSSY